MFLGIVRPATGGDDMAAQRIDVYRVEIEDRPGALQEMLSGVAEADLNLLHLAAFSCGGAKGMAYCVSDKPDGLREFAGSRGQGVEKCAGFLLSGIDRVGVGAEVTRPLSDAGINVVVGTATVSEGDYYLLIIVEDKDGDAAAAALGA